MRRVFDQFENTDESGTGHREWRIADDGAAAVSHTRTCQTRWHGDPRRKFAALTGSRQCALRSEVHCRSEWDRTPACTAAQVCVGLRGPRVYRPKKTTKNYGAPPSVIQIPPTVAPKYSCCVAILYIRVPQILGPTYRCHRPPEFSGPRGCIGYCRSSGSSVLYEFRHPP